MKIEKYISVLIAFFILIPNMNYAINLHYCGGEVASVSIKSLYKTEKATTNCCESKQESMPCCHDKLLKLQKKAPDNFQQLPVFHFDAIVLTTPVILIKETSFQQINKDTSLDYFCDAHAPPLFKLHKQLLFYA